MFENIPFLPARPICIIGDSNCFLFGTRVIDMPEIFARPIVLKSFAISGLHASACSPNGELHPEFVTFLRSAQIPRTVAAINMQEELNRYRGYPLWKPRADSTFGEDEPVVLLILGMMDFFQIVAEIGPLSDFYIEDPLFNERSFPVFPELPLTPRSVVDDSIARRLAPVATALRAIRDRGVRQVYLHGMYPPTTDDDQYFRAREVNSIARVRYKIAILMNRELRRLADAHGFVLIDPWEEFTANGVVSERFYLDGTHLNVDAAQISTTHLLREVVGRRSANARERFGIAEAL